MVLYYIYWYLKIAMSCNIGVLLVVFFRVSLGFHFIAWPNSGEQTLTVHGSVFCTVVHLYYTQQSPHTPYRKIGHVQFSGPQLLLLVYWQLCIIHLCSHLFTSQLSTQTYITITTLFAEKDVIKSSQTGFFFFFLHNFNPQVITGCRWLSRSQMCCAILSIKYLFCTFIPDL